MIGTLNRTTTPAWVAHFARDDVTARVAELLVLECRCDDSKGRIRRMSRKELLDDVRAVSIPAAGAQPGTLLTPRDVRKVDPHFAARLEPTIITRTGCITVSLGRTNLRAIITRERLYFVVPDGADSIINTVQNNLAILRSGEAVGEHARLPNGRGSSNEGREAGDGNVVDRTEHLTDPLSGATEQEDGSSVPFELAALEALLTTACSEMQKQQAQLTLKVNRALQALRRTVVGSRVVAGDEQLEQVTVPTLALS